MLKMLKLPKRSVSQFKPLILGGGSAGMAMSWKMAKYHKSRFVTGMVDAAEQHYYQPLWTLVGGGLKSFDKSEHQMVETPILLQEGV